MIGDVRHWLKEKKKEKSSHMTKPIDDYVSWIPDLDRQELNRLLETDILVLSQKLDKIKKKCEK